jgi:hypothetical protein
MASVAKHAAKQALAGSWATNQETINASTFGRAMAVANRNKR